MLHAARIELDADKGRQPTHARASSDFLVMHGAVALLDPALKECVRGPKIVETAQHIGVLDVAAVDLLSAWGWHCFWEVAIGSGRWTRRPWYWRGQCSWNGGRNVEDEKKGAIHAAHEESMEGDEAGALEMEDAEAVLDDGLCKEAEGISSRTMSLSRAMWRSLRLALSGTEATRGASSASTADMTQWVRGTRGQGQQFQRHLR